VSSPKALSDEAQPTALSRVYARRERHRQRPLPVRIAAAAAGFVVLAAGVVLVPVFPEGAILLAVAALGILALEFDWAARALTWTLGVARRARAWLRKVPLWATVLFTLVVVAIIVVVVLAVLGIRPF
jgi:hypothetical protein